jgi:hypothetical protein
VAKQNETRTFTGRVCDSCRVRQDVEMTAMFAVGDERTEWHGKCENGHDFVLHTPEAFEITEEHQMNHNDEVIEETDRVLNVEIWIDHAATGDAADLDPMSAFNTLIAAGVAVLGLPRKTAFDGCYHVDTTRAWWDEMIRSGDDLDVEVAGYHVLLALV